MNNLLVVALLALAVPGVFLLDSLSQWIMRLVLTDSGRRPETVAELSQTVTAVNAGAKAKLKAKAKPELKHAHAA